MGSRVRPKTSVPNLLNAFIQFGNVEYTLVRENYILFVAVVREKGLFFQEKVRESQGIIFLTTCINPEKIHETVSLDPTVNSKQKP